MFQTFSPSQEEGSCLKVERETTHILRTKGYCLAYHDGHGKQHPSAVLRTLHLLAFPVQLVREEADHKSQQAFFQDLQALTRSLVCESWER